MDGTASSLHTQVADILRTSPAGAEHGQAVFRRPVCAMAFCRLLGIGKQRFQKLRQAVRLGDALPVDGRFVARAKVKTPHPHRVLVHEFLEEIWATLSEPMPEASEPGVVRQLRFRKARGKRPKVSSRQHHMDKKDRKDLRMLPPGTFSDYLGLLNSRHPEDKISLKLFSSVASSDGWFLFSGRSMFSGVPLVLVCISIGHDTKKYIYIVIYIYIMLPAVAEESYKKLGL